MLGWIDFENPLARLRPGMIQPQTLPQGFPNMEGTREKISWNATKKNRD